MSMRRSTAQGNVQFLGGRLRSLNLEGTKYKGFVQGVQGFRTLARPPETPFPCLLLVNACSS
jgi:hypothetical protein